MVQAVVHPLGKQPQLVPVIQRAHACTTLKLLYTYDSVKRDGMYAAQDAPAQLQQRPLSS